MEDRRFEVQLTKAQVEKSPTWLSDQPVSRQMERCIYDYYGWDPRWGAPYPGGASGAMGSPLMAPPFLGFGASAVDESISRNSDDPHLRSFAEVIGYLIHATDGDIGHLENLMLDDSDWSLPYFIVDTSNWWFGARVLIVPGAVTTIEWSDRRVRVNVSRDQVKASPIWDPLVAFNTIYAKLTQQQHRPAPIGATAQCLPTATMPELS